MNCPFSQLALEESVCSQRAQIPPAVGLRRPQQIQAGGAGCALLWEFHGEAPRIVDFLIPGGARESVRGERGPGFLSHTDLAWNLNSPVGLG